MSTARGSWGAMNGANTETAMMRSRTPAAAIPPPRRTSRRHAAPRTDPASGWAVVISVSSTGVGTLIAKSGGANAGVDEPHDDVDDQVDRHDEQRQEHHGALHHREVLVADRLHGEGGH